MKYLLELEVPGLGNIYPLKEWPEMKEVLYFPFPLPLQAKVYQEGGAVELCHTKSFKFVLRDMRPKGFTFSDGKTVPTGFICHYVLDDIE